jgi:hypothetical protein
MDRIRAVIQKIIVAVQAVMMPVLLTIVYVIVLGATVILAALFGRRLLGTGPANASSFWRDAEGYDEGLDDARRQS